jgi:hypothetical protein
MVDGKAKNQKLKRIDNIQKPKAKIKNPGFFWPLAAFCWLQFIKVILTKIF